MAKLSTIILCCVLLIVLYPATLFSQPTDPIQTAEDFIQQKNYQKALDALAQNIPRERTDYGQWLAALANFKKGNKAQAMKICTTFITTYPLSQWIDKIRFLMADIFVSNKDYGQAVTLYETFAKNLLGGARKEKIARVYMTYAESLSYTPLPEELGLPKPDYNKAYQTYAEVLHLEIGDSLREETIFRMARMKHLAADFSQARDGYIAYLGEFDPDWRGGNSIGLKKASVTMTGKHIREARLYLAETRIALSDFLGARLDLIDLVSLIEKKGDQKGDAGKKYHRMALRRVPFTYNFPNPQTDFDLESGIKATDAFLSLYPDDSIAPTLARNRAFALISRGRTEEGIKALEDFSDKKGFAVNPKESVDEKAAREALGISRSPAEQYDTYHKEAIYTIGTLLASQKKFKDAIEVYSAYIAQFPNGEHWTLSQSGIVESQYQIGVELIRAKKFVEAENAWNDFLVRYPLDERSRKILFTLAQVSYEEGKKAKENKKSDEAKSDFTKALAGFRRLVSKHPGREESSLAQLRAGEILENELSDLEAALDSYKKLTWGTYASEAALRVERMVNKELIVATERIWRTPEQAKIKVRVRNIEKLTCSAYRLDLEAYFRKTHGITAIEQLDLSLIAPDKSWEITLPGYVKYLPIDTEISVPMDAPGAYAVNVASDELEATTIVIKSDIDIIVKSSKKEALVFVENMVSGIPVTGAQVIITDGVRVLAEEQTGANGILLKSIPELAASSKINVFASIRGSIASTGLSVAALSLSSGLSPKGYIYTDLPAYKPGQDVNIRGIVRDIANGSYSIPQAKAARYVVVVTDPKGKTIFSDEVPLGELGTFNSTVKLSDKAAIGSYTIIASNKDLARAFSGRFPVEQYKIEKVKLECVFDKPVYFRGEEVKASFRASYYYGQPVRDAELRYTTPLGLTMTGITDDNGILVIGFDSTPFRPGSSLSFACTLVSENVSTRSSVPLASREYELAIASSREELRSGESMEVTVVATDAAGNRVSKDAEITMYEITSVGEDTLFESVPWLAPKDMNAAENGEIAIEAKRIKTNEKGIGRVVFIPNKGGNFLVRAKSTDRFGNIVSAETRVFVSGDDDSQLLRMFATRNHYAVGENDTLVLYSRLGHTSVGLVTFEGEGIISYSVVALNEKENRIKLAIENQYFPNFAVSVAAMDGNRLYTASVPFTVERGLFVKIKPDKDYYGPGEQATIAIEVTDQNGKPVKAELSLSLTNEALLALYRDNSPDITSYFEEGAARKAEMVYSSSCSFSYSGVTKAVLKEIVEEETRVKEKNKEVSKSEYKGRGEAEDQEALADEMESNKPIAGLITEESNTRTSTSEVNLSGKKDEGKPEVRKESETASFWIGSILSNADGKASASIPIPRLTSSYKIRMKGVTRETLVGQSEAKLVVRKDFFASIKAPASLQEKDEVRFIGRVHNVGTFNGKVAAILSVRNGETELARSESSITVAQSEIKEIVFPALTVPDVRELSVRVSIKADNGAKDDVSVDVPVRPWGLPFEVRKAGVAADSRTVFLSLPADRTYETSRMDITLYPAIEMTLINSVLGNTLGNEYSEDIPSIEGGPESELIAMVSLLGYLKDRNTGAYDYSSLMDKARALTGELVASQAQGGFWSLPDGTENIAITSEAYWALVAARQQGIVVDDRTLALAKDYLAKIYSSVDQNDNESKAEILHALALSKDADYTFVNRLYRSRNEISDAACALTALSLALLDKNEMGKDMLRSLDSRMKTIELTGGTGAYWTGEGNRPWLRNPVETTSLALLAYQAIEPDSRVIAKAAGYLMSVKEERGFSPGKALGPAICALTEYYGKIKPKASDFSVDISVNGKSIGRLDAQKKTGGTLSALLIEVPKDALSLKENKVELVYSGAGEYYYSIGLSGFSKDVKDPHSWQDPAVANKNYIHEPLRYNGRVIGYSTQEITQLEYGKTMDVRIDFSSGYVDRYLVLEEYIPSGCVVLADTIKGNFSQVLVREGSIVFSFKPDTYISRITYSLAPYVPGKFNVLPPRLVDAFDQGEMRIGSAKTLTVLAPGESSNEAYVMNQEELFGMGSAYFGDTQYKEALGYLEQLYAKDHAAHEPQVAQMLLWIRTEESYYDAKKLIEYFEILKEKYPELSIPFEKILAVGKAYKEIGEAERSYLVYRATVDASFTRDASAGGYLERSGEFTHSIEYMSGLLYEYPDTGATISAMFALSQELYIKAPEAATLVSRTIPSNKGEKPAAYTKVQILEMARAMLRKFMTMYPDNELADDAAFTTLNITLDEKDYDKTILLSRDYQARYKESSYVTNYQFMEALAQFSRRNYDDAVRIAEIVANGSNENNSLATYILGQIYHARRNPEKAIAYYKNIASVFPDALGAIDLFESKAIGIDEVTVFAPGERLSVKLSYKNIKEANIQVYKVDLMKLYLQEKNLSRIAGVNLSGITPFIEKKVAIGNGKDYETKSRELGLDIKDEGAYLLVIRGDDLFASGLVLCTPLDIVIQEEADSGRIRINVYDKVKKLYPDSVHVKAIGSENTEFVSGDTDMRGIFVADGIRGVPTVIARDLKNRYAFYRGKTWLGAKEETPVTTTDQENQNPNFDDTYRGNLNKKQEQMNEENRANLDNLYEQDIKGVQVQQAY